METAKTDPGKRKALSMAIKQIEKDYGKGAIMWYKDGQKVSVEVIPTGAINLDIATGIGGYPRGRIIEIYGPESSGKTTLTLHALAEAQNKGGVVAFIDAEHALDPIYASKLGVNIDELLISQPDSGEQALEIVEALVRSNAVDVIVVDSVAALVPRAEIEGEMGDAHMGVQARLMSQALRKLAGVIKKSNATVIFTNQIRMKIGVFFGNPETTTGGNALKFYASMRFEVRKVETLKKGDEIYGHAVRVKVVKNKLAPPFRRAQFDILYGKGISRTGSILDTAVEKDIVNKSGAWYSYKEDRLGQGKDNVRNYLEENPEILSKIEGELRAIIDREMGIIPEEESKAEKPEKEEKKK